MPQGFFPFTLHPPPNNRTAVSMGWEEENRGRERKRERERSRRRKRKEGSITSTPTHELTTTKVGPQRRWMTDEMREKGENERKVIFFPHHFQEEQKIAAIFNSVE